MKKPVKKPVKKQATVFPAPDVKNATREILNRVAAWMETPEAASVIHTGVNPQRQEERNALVEARALAVGYVKMGAQSR